ncbi:hypothetical protein [Heliophilum fasciatum]|uniref:Uncharacterized protein n=1 Tax=Heliophilum fasciatum TaxID=35700 RepID=A0A4R2RQZ7_9FIRM|nr:hypothetical protein [Heliophilum fasciatum]MCW2277500.1 hypothetical protein [Heliophilum fasciatum]TCP65209.1 hypothetical protein EDD73_10693 [Heliophilum fasciatum]
MTVSTMTIVTLRCPVCGRMEFHALSLFAFAGRKNQKLYCSCGAEVMTVGSKDRRQFWLQIHCIMCETQHLYWFTRKQLWAHNLIDLQCVETLVDIGYVGPRDKVKAAIMKQEKSLQEMAADLGVADYFENPEIMYEVLERLHQLAEAGLLSCTCGSRQIAVEVFPDRVELRCEVCDHTCTCYAESDNDLESVKRFDNIQIQGAYHPVPRNRGARKRPTKKTT